MTTRFLRQHAFFFVLGLAVMGMAFTGSPALADDAGKSAECTNSHLRDIKMFNSKAKRKIKDYDELVERAPDMTTVRDAKEFTEDSNRIIDFFRSDEFSAMEDVYEMCGMVIPRPMSKQGFWIPEEQRIYYGAF